MLIVCGCLYCVLILCGSLYHVLILCVCLYCVAVYCVLVITVQLSPCTQTRMMTLQPDPNARYRSVLDALVRIAKTEQPRNLFRGMSVVATAAGPAHALYFSMYESIKSRISGKSPVVAQGVGSSRHALQPVLCLYATPCSMYVHGVQRALLLPLTTALLSLTPLHPSPLNSLPPLHPLLL